MSPRVNKSIPKEKDIIEHIIGYPSGQVINITKKELMFLMNLGLADWDNSMQEWIFNDKVLDEIKDYLSRIYVDNIVYVSGRKATVKQIIKDYNGQRVNGKDVSKIFKYGRTLYIIRFFGGGEGIYTYDQIKKQRTPDDIFV